MDNTSNHQQDESSWIPTIEEQRRDPSLQVCLGCGQWFSAKSEICTCWIKSDHQRRKITVDEFRSMLDKLVMLRDDDDDDEPNPLAWAEEAGLVNPVTCPYCGAIDYVTDDELAQYNAYALDLPCSQCGRVHSK